MDITSTIQITLAVVAGAAALTGVAAALRRAIVDDPVAVPERSRIR